MRPIIVLCFMAGLFAADPAKPAELANDHVYAEKAQVILTQRPDGKDQQKLYDWLWSYFLACTDRGGEIEGNTPH